jgi:hypothetical protein
LENIFIGQPLSKPGEPENLGKEKLSQDYATSTLMIENNELRRKVAQLEQEKADLKMILQSQGL